MALFELFGYIKKKNGTLVNRRLRRTGKIPAVIYGKSKKTYSIFLKYDDFFNFFKKNINKDNTFCIKFSNSSEKVKIKSFQSHPVKKQIIHVDFIRA